MKARVIIVGGGPAGTSAGIHLLMSKFDDVTIIDKSIFPRNKLCGGLVTADAIPELEKMGIDLNDKTVFHTNTYVRYYNKKRLINEYQNIKHFVVQRTDFDNLLMKRFKELGGKTIEGDMVVTIDTKKNIVTTKSGLELPYDFLIGADGANSRVRNAINKTKPDNAFCAQVTAPLTPDTEDTVSVIFNKVTAGFAWKFATKTDVKIGVGSFDNPKTLIKFIKKDNPNLKVQGAFVPYGNLPTVRAKKNIFLAGDAGGYVDPVLGEGISFAINHGAFYPKILKSKDPVAKYEELYAKMVKHIKAGVKMRKIFFHKWFHQHALNYFSYAPATTEAITNKVVMTKEIQYYDIPKLIKLALKP